MSNVTLRGFTDASRVDESAYPTAFGATGSAGMARLPVEDTPVYDGTGKTRTGIRRFGAVGNDANDDTRDGKTTILKAGDLPSRGFDKARGPQYLIPLYK